jgi:DNA-binding NarL/FixJ family response regulator
MPELREPVLDGTTVDGDVQASRFVRVLVADDQSVVPTGCRLRLDGEPRVVVVGETSRPHDVVGLARAVVPRIVLIATAPGDATVALVRATCAAARRSDVVVVSSRTDADYVRRCLDAGARGFVDGDDPAVGPAIRAVAGGGAYFSPQVATLLRDGFVRRGGVPIDHLLHGFDDLDRAVLRGVLAGRSTEDLAADLSRPVAAIERRRARIVARLASADRDGHGA